MRLFEGTVFDRIPVCEFCGNSETNCTCSKPKTPRIASNQQGATVTVEKRKRGKVVTLIRGLVDGETDFNNLVKKLKSTCGAGGTYSGNQIEIQGDHLQRISEILKELGYRLR